MTLMEDLISMNSERTQAYGRVVKTLEELGPAKLQTNEQARVREAADTLIFASDMDDARVALEDIHALSEHLVESGRWSDALAERLVDDILSSGPLTPTA